MAFVESFKKYWENESHKMTFIGLESEAFISQLHKEIPTYGSDCDKYGEDLQAAAVEYIELNGSDDYQYTNCLGNDFRRTIDNEDWIRLQVLYHAFWLNNPSDISDSLSYCTDKLVEYSLLQVKLNQDKLVDWNRGSTIECFVEMIECYDNPIAVPSLEKVCALSESDDVGAVRKAIWALCGIKTRESFQVIKHCMHTYPDEWIKEQAGEAISYLQRVMLVDENEEWITN